MDNAIFTKKFNVPKLTYLVSIDKGFEIEDIASLVNLSFSTVSMALSLLESENKIKLLWNGWVLTAEGKKEVYY